MNPETLAGWYVIDAVKGLGPGKCRAIHEAGLQPHAVLTQPDALPIGGKTGDMLRAGLADITEEQRRSATEDAQRDLARALELDTQIVGYDHPKYPQRLYDSNYPVPVLFVRGDVDALNPRAVACVGSRAIRDPYASLQARFANVAALEGFTIVSGFATGADTIAHDAAVGATGRTVAVLPNGLDLVFPPENRERWHSWLESPGVAFVSDFRFGRRADALALRKRNKLIVALAGAVLVGQSSAKGGAMNAFRFAIEQKKRVATFESDGHEDTSGNAVIAAPQKVPTTAFPLTEELADWIAWLQQSAQ